MKAILKLILVFFILFDLSFQISPELSLGKIGIFVLSIYYLLSKKKPKIEKFEWYIFIMYAFVLLHLIVIFLLQGMPENTAMARMIYYLLYSVWASIIFAKLFDNKREFFYYLVIAIFIQSIFVIISWVSVDYRILIDQLLVQTGNISLLNENRPPGLMNSAGAKASVVLALGASLSLYIITTLNSVKRIILLSFVFVVISLATFIIGRTGLLLLLGLSISILTPVFLRGSFYKRGLVLISTLTITFVIVLISIPSGMNESVILKIDWVTDEFSGGLLNSHTVNVLSDMNIKQIKIDTIIGTSEIRPAGGEHDSGYIQNYHSFGLIFTVVLYIIVISHIFILLNNRHNKSFYTKNKFFISALLLGLFLVEIKEPFVLSYTYPMIIYTILRLRE